MSLVWRGRGSNPGPPVPRADALTTVLRRGGSTAVRKLLMWMHFIGDSNGYQVVSSPTVEDTKWKKWTFIVTHLFAQVLTLAYVYVNVNFLFCSTNSCFWVTGHFEISAPNNPKWPWTLKGQMYPYYIQIITIHKSQSSLNFALRLAVFELQAILRQLHWGTPKWH